MIRQEVKHENMKHHEIKGNKGLVNPFFVCI